MAISGALYKRIGRAAAGAVAIVAVKARGTGAVTGLTVSSFVTLSFDPPMVMFAIQQSADCYPSIVSSREFGVSLLGGGQAAIARVFATKGVDKSSAVEFARGAMLDVPLIPTAIAHVECLTSQITLSGDHAIVVGTVEAADTSDGEPLLYFSGRYGTFSPFEAGS